MIESEAAEARLECLVVETIVKAAFSEDVLSYYNELYYECSVEFIKKAVADGICTKEDGHKTFEHQDTIPVQCSKHTVQTERVTSAQNINYAGCAATS